MGQQRWVIITKGHKRNAALAKEAREKKLEDILDRLHHKEDLQAQKRAGAPEDAAAAENENIQVYRGNQVMVVQDADRSEFEFLQRLLNMTMMMELTK